MAARAGARSYLADLNPEQRAAVETLDGPVLVLAGAGTGKTRVLTTRIAHILATGRARPAEILAVTFTNKAAREMKERVGNMVGQAVEGMPWLGTFHAIGVKILRRHAELVGLKSDFTILDADDQIRLLKQLLEAEGIDEKRWPARVLAGLIDHWKNRGLTPDQVPSGEAAAFANGRGKKLYAAYQERLKMLNAADFGDLLLENIRLFREQPGGAGAVPAALQVHPGGRVPGHQRGAVSVAAADCAAGRRRARPHPPPSLPGRGERSDPGARMITGSRAFDADPRSPGTRAEGTPRNDGATQSRRPHRPKTSAASATTTSRSTAGAAPRSTTSCASTTTFPARRSSGWSGTTAAPDTSSPRRAI